MRLQNWCEYRFPLPTVAASLTVVNALHVRVCRYLENLGRRPSPDELLRVSIHILRGLQFLHNGPTAVVHRDLKPENILVFVIDGHLVAKIADVGLARNETYFGTHSFAGAVAGTPMYMVRVYVCVRACECVGILCM